MSQPATPFGATQGFSQPVDVGVSWSNIRYKVGDREILKGLTGNALPRRALAIMGSSGAGKTTFLNALSDRLESDGKHAILSGERFLESVEYSRRFRTMIGYVTQEDVLDATSTPDEILSFSLRVRRGVSPEETTAQVDAMIDELGLTKARDTVVGIPGIITGLSGGERKRCNIGSELITNPKLLYLDEPTSGLDSVTSVNVCELLRKLAARGRTVVYTIHQPTAEVVACFDDLMLMCKGHVVYHGPMEESIDYFTSIGYPCPESHTPTDYFMSLLQDEEIGDVLIEKWQAFLSDPTNENHVYTTPRVASNDEFTKQYLDSYAEAATGTYAIEFTELMKRSLHSVARNKLFITTSIVQNVGFALIAGLIFVNLKDTVTGISDRMGLLFMVSANMAFSGAMGVLNVFPPKKAVFIREQQSGAYSPLLFFLTMSMAEIPVQVLGLLLQSVLIYFITGLQLNTAGGFFMYFAITVMLQQVSIGVGYAVGTAIDSFVVASGFVPLIIIPLMLCSGLLASTDRLRPYWYWLEKPSFIRAAFLLYADNEFGNLPEITCDPAKFGADFCLRQPKTGDQVLTSFQFNDDHGAVWLQWVILVIMFFIPRILTVLFLYRTARRKS